MCWRPPRHRLLRFFASRTPRTKWVPQLAHGRGRPHSLFSDKWSTETRYELGRGHPVSRLMGAMVMMASIHKTHAGAEFFTLAAPAGKDQTA